MATWDDVRRVALALPEVTESASRWGLQWKVRDRLVAWERPLTATERRALGGASPDGPLLGVRVPDLGVKEALLAEEGGVVLTTPHFDGYPAVLVRLERIDRLELAELVTDAWRLRAPRKLVLAHESASPSD